MTMVLLVALAMLAGCGDDDGEHEIRHGAVDGDGRAA